MEDGRRPTRPQHHSEADPAQPARIILAGERAGDRATLRGRSAGARNPFGDGARVVFCQWSGDALDIVVTQGDTMTTERNQPGGVTMGDFNIVAVPAKVEGGVKSGVTVRRDDVFTISGSGRAEYDQTPRVTYPDGTRYINDKFAGAHVAATVLPGVPVGTLIARVGTGPWFAAGCCQTFCAQEDGEITVAYNDRAGMYGDNSGEYTALIENHGKPS
ncbi:LecA/PA-IL family lectin [Streptomyces sp. NPDC058290]|uniref:LecA/PA-IL family lectin n=2 Tax=unclassified Streptomyces TaxID=2593676 RepID=UPI0036F16027